MNLTTAIIILVFITAFLIGAIAYVVYKALNEKNENVKIFHNGTTVELSPSEYEDYLKQKRLKQQKEEEEKQRLQFQQQEELKQKVSELNSKIKDVYCKADNAADEKSIYQILQMEALTEQEYEHKKWLFNDGKFRTASEVQEYESQLKPYTAEDFHREAFLTNLLAFFVPFIIVVGLIMLLSDHKVWFIILPFAVLFGLIASLITMSLGHSVNLDKAESHGIPDSDPQVQFEKREQEVAKIATIASAAHIAHHTKKNIKKLSNPDSWEKMK